MVKLGSFDIHADPEEDAPVPSPLHGKISLPVSRTHFAPSPTKPLPLSPKGNTKQAAPLSCGDGKARIGSFNFPPPTRTQAAAISHDLNQQRLDSYYRTPNPEPPAVPSNTSFGDDEAPAIETVGEWKLGEKLGKGTSGTVYLARSTKDASFAAVKRVKRVPQHHKEAALIHREIALMKLGSPHPHLVELFDVYESRSHLYLVTEFCPLGELFQYVTVTALTKVERCRFYSQLISALLHLSRLSISHRDIKFENLLLYRGDHGYLSLKVADMGMATVQLEGTRLTTSCGSPHYAAPEVISGTPYAGELADVWSAGVVLFAMIARRLPFDNPDVPELLKTIKEGQFEMDSEIVAGSHERELVDRSLRKDPNERLSLKQISTHPYCYTTIYVLDCRFREQLAQIVTAGETEKDDHQGRLNQDFDDVENLELPVLASLGIVLKVSTLDEVKDMLRSDRNHARLFYSKLLQFRNCQHPPVSTALQRAYFDAQHFDELRYDDHDDDSMELSVTPSQFPDPPRPRTLSFPSFDPDHLDTDRAPPDWTHQPRASLPDSRLLHNIAPADPSLHSAPPQTLKFPPAVVCLHDFGPVASAPPQIESFLTEALPLSPSVKESISRRNSVVTVDEDNLPFLNLEDSPVSPKSIPCPTVINTSFSPSSRIGAVVQKRSMHQRIRSLLSTTSALPAPRPPTSSPRVGTSQAQAHARPASPTPSTTSSRLTRSNAYRSLGRALLGKAPKSPALLSSGGGTEELSHAERVVLETLVPSFSPIPPFALDFRSKGKGKAAIASGEGAGQTFASISFLDPATLGDGSRTIEKTSTIKKKLSIGMLQFFHDDGPSTSLEQPSNNQPYSLPSPSSSPTTSTKLTKEQRRPKALSIASSNHRIPSPPSRSPTRATSSLAKKLSLLSFGTTSTNQASPPALSNPILLPTPSPLSLDFSTTSTATPVSLDGSLGIRSVVSVGPRSTGRVLGPRPASSGFARPPPPIPTILRRRSTLSSPLSATIDPSPSSPSTTTDSCHSSLSNRRTGPDALAATTKLQLEKLEFENQLLRSRVRAIEGELERMREREKEWIAIVNDAVGSASRESRGRGRACEEKKRHEEAFGSKTQFDDEAVEEVDSRGRDDEERWIENLVELEKGFTGV